MALRGWLESEASHVRGLLAPSRPPTSDHLNLISWQEGQRLMHEAQPWSAPSPFPRDKAAAQRGQAPFRRPHGCRTAWVRALFLPSGLTLPAHPELVTCGVLLPWLDTNASCPVAGHGTHHQEALAYAGGGAGGGNALPVARTNLTTQAQGIPWALASPTRLSSSAEPAGWAVQR